MQTSAAVIERVHLLAKGMPALPIFTDRAGCVIGDVEDVYLYNIEDEDVEALVDNSNLPGVHTAEADDQIPGVDMVQEQDIDVDLDFAPADDGNVKPPLVDIPPPVNDASGEQGTYRWRHPQVYTNLHATQAAIHSCIQWEDIFLCYHGTW